MAVASRKIRSRMLLTTAVAAIAALPSAVHAQLVLNNAVDSAGTAGPRLDVNPGANPGETDLTLNSQIVVAEWNQFDVQVGDVVNVDLDPALMLTEGTLFNRVIGGGASIIDGTINATGINFWLVNQNGILFGTDSTINAQSFFASTVDVANQDVFDFYEGTDLFGNGTDTLNFAGPSTNAVQALGNASFVTDGSLAFVGQQLDLTGSFDAGTGRAIFVTASDVDVSFTAGSPLTYTVNAGTTIAAQSIDGTIQGASAEFAMFTSAGVVGALLDIDATVTATTAVATDTGIALLASGPSSVTVEIGGEFSSTGLVALTSNGDLTATADISGSDLDLNAGGAISALDLTSTDGNVDLSAGTTITAGAVDTSGNGGAILTAAGAITTTSITSNEPGATNGFIDVQSTGGGALDLGALVSDGDIDLDTSGSVTTSTINSLGDLTIGGTTDPGAVTFTGNVSADAIDIDTTGLVTGLDIESTDGDLNILAADTISAGGVTATEGDVILSATNNITTTSITSNEAFGSGGAIDIDSTGGGALDLGAVSGDGAANLDTTGTLTLGLVNIGGALDIGSTNMPALSTFNGNITAASFAFTTANPFVAQDITTTAGNLDIDAASIMAGALSATGGDASLTTTGDITTTSINATTAMAMGGNIDVDSTAGGNLNLGNLTADQNINLDTTGSLTANDVTAGGDLLVGVVNQPNPIVFTGNITASSLTFNTANPFTANDLTATAGDVDIDAPSIAVGAVSATGGDVELTTTGDITTTSITANTAMAMGGAIDVDSTAGGVLSLGGLTADGGINVDTAGTVFAGTVVAGGPFDVGSTATPFTVSLTGDVTAASVNMLATASISGQNITATAGMIDLEANQQALFTLAATDDVVLNGGTSIVVTSVTADSDMNSAGAVSIGAVTAPVTLTVTGATTGASVTTSAGTANFADVTSGAGSIALTATSGGLTTANVTANGAGSSLSLNSSGAGGNVNTGTVNSNGGNILVSASVDITAGAVSTALMGAPSAATVGLHAGGSVNTGQLAAGEDLRIEAVNGTVTIPGATAGDDIVIDAGGAVDLQGPVSADGSGMDLLEVSFAGLPGSSSLVFAAETLTGSNIVIDTPAVLTATDLTASAGGIDVDAGSIAANVLSATGGDVLLTTTGSTTTASITAIASGVGGAIDVDSTGGGALDLGDLTADTTIALDTASTLMANTVAAGGALTVGGTAQPSAITFAGNVSAASMDIDGAATGTLNALDLTATAGDIDIDVGSVTAIDVSATGNVALDGAGTVSLTNATADSENNAMGDLSIGTMTIPALLTVTGTASGVNASLHGTTLNATTVTATGGDVVLSGGTVTVGTAQATNDVIADAITSITADTITADSDLSGMGDVEVGQITRPGLLTVTTSVTGVNVTLEADTLNVINGLSTNGNTTLIANTITTTDVTATGGDVTLQANGNVTTDTITATAIGGAGGNIDVDSAMGGALDLGDLAADAGIALDTSGTVTADVVSAVGALQVGGTAQPSAITFTGNVTTSSMDIDGAANGTLNAQDLTATAGDIDIDIGSTTAGDVSATGNVALDGAGTISLTNANADSDSNAMGDLSIGTNTTPAQLTVTGVASGVNSSLHADVLNVTTVTATGGDVVLSGGTLTVGTATATNNVIADATTAITIDTMTADSDASGAGDVQVGLMATPDQLTVNNAVTGVNVTLQADTMNVASTTATGGDATFNASGDITTGTITATMVGIAGGNIDVDSTGGGALDLGDMNAGAGIALDTSGSITTDLVNAGGTLQVGGTALPTTVDFTGNVTAGAIDIDAAATGTVTALDLTATAGDIDVDTSSLTANLVSATGNILIDGAGTVSLATATADSDGDLSGDVLIGTNVAPNTVTIAGPSSGGNVSVRSLGMLTTGTVTATAGDVTIDAGDAATTSDVVASGNITIQSGATLAAQTVTAMGGDVTLSATDAMTQAVQATGNVTVDGSGTVTLASVTADSDMNGAGDLTIGTTTAPSDLTITGASSGVTTTIVSAGALTVDTVEATGGNATMTAGANITANTVNAMGGDAVLDAVGAITTNAITASTAGMAGGAIDVDSTGGGALSLDDLIADAGIALDTTGAVSANQVTAGGALQVGGAAAPAIVTFTDMVAAASVGITSTGDLSAQDITATTGSIIADTGSITAGAVTATDDVTLDAAGAMNLASVLADSNNSGVGDIAIGTIMAPSDLTIAGAVSGANVTLASAGTTTTGAVSATAGDTTITSGGAATIANVSTTELAIQSGALLTIGAINASGSAVLESADVDLRAAVDVDGASLTLRSAPGVSVGVGSGAGDYQLSDAELDLIDTGTLIVDAVDQEIAIGGVTFTDQAGANEVVLASSGAGSIIRVTGDIMGAGAGRLFRFGADAATGMMLSERIIMDIEGASIDFGDATFDLRAEDIVFGQQALIDAVAGRDSGDIAASFVGDANSLLYNPLLAGGLGGARVADPVYLRAGNFSVTYGNSALFQNTAPPQEGGTLFTGLTLGQPGGAGTLSLNVTDDTNTFAFFGQINELVGTAAALAGNTVILLGTDVRTPDSRVNGCVIGSGADCVTTIVGTTTISIPREVVELLTADTGLLVPFDPLVGTNNEGLFSDAAVEPDEDCERDENGACVQ